MVGLLTWLVACGVSAQEPEPETYVDVPVPRLTEWNNVNARTVIEDTASTTAIFRHTRQAEEVLGRTYIYPDQATKDADPDGTGAGSVAFIGWALDDGSGRPPGIQAVTDDYEFPVANCIMASGERIDEEFGELVPKTCSDPQGSSKRYFLEVTQADVPIDLVFDTGMKDIRYKGVKDPEDDGGAALEAFREEYGIGRIYRVIQKFINNTDERIVSLRVELGTGVGDDFVPLSFEEDGVAFEMRPLVPREFFEGETGAPDREVWQENRYATFAPKLFDDGLRPRFDPGFFSDAAAGIFPPQDVEGPEKSQYIESGYQVTDGRIGAITLNYFDMPNQQAAGAGLTGNLFGYMMPDLLVPTVIALHEDGDPETESDAVVAWWDGSDWRYGQAGDPDTGADPWSVVPLDELEQWASFLLGQNIPDSDPGRFESLLSDDLSGANMDTYIYIGEEIVDETTGMPRYDSLTLRLIPTSVSSLGLGDIAGSEDPEWTLPGNEPPTLESYMPATGEPVAINDIAVTDFEQPVTINILANDLLDGALIDPDPAVSTVVITSQPANGTATLDGTDNTVDFVPDAGFEGDNTFNYTVEIDGVVSNEATVKVTVNPEPVPNAPVAENDFAETFREIPATIDVLANDTFQDGPIPVDLSTITIVDQPLSGTASVENDAIVYTPDEGFLGFERFTYRVTTDGNDSNLALITVRVDEWPADFDFIFSDRFEAVIE
ncbi:MULTISPECIES: choice-of-anchor F family protein [unclassified Wenzhouxiangella]|uniref:choice-of-anchor F family protein n=1 Tax=unclassified Wenzhouxiangella TaxID=2613841 RepID=UPI0015F29CF6|nr:MULTISPECIES: choice-of-anchor F family protein [unclassified Wenzhouxiangella]